jgi:hypothetical protein
VPRRRTLVEALEATRELQFQRSVSEARLSRARRQAIAQAPPSVAFMSYQNAAAGLTERAALLLERHVTSKLPELGSGGALDVGALDRGLADLELDLLAAARAMERNGAAAFRRATDHARVEAQRILNVKIPVDKQGEEVARHLFAERQVQLFQRAARDQVTELRQALADYQDGDSLRKLLEHELWVMRNRDRLIARNEVFKLSELEIERWSRLTGSLGFFYHTAADEKVRETHWAHEGKFFYWDEAPKEMGEVNCRCRKVPAEAGIGAA